MVFVAQETIENLFGTLTFVTDQPDRRVHRHDRIGQLGTVLEASEKLLREHSRIEQSSFRVRLIRFGSSSLDVELFACVLTRDWREFLAIQQGLLIRIIQIVESSGNFHRVSFADPVFRQQASRGLIQKPGRPSRIKREKSGD